MASADGDIDLMNRTGVFKLDDVIVYCNCWTTSVIVAVVANWSCQWSIVSITQLPWFFVALIKCAKRAIIA